jgi:hypothetical protein
MEGIWLHDKRRRDALMTTEEHLSAAANLSRCLWELTESDELNTQDVRSREALRELASAICDHASAANFTFHTKQETCE